MYRGFRIFQAGVGLVLLLAACSHNGGGSSKPSELAGVFKAGNVSGLGYRTPTREGVTDTQGTFKFLPGETVTFFVGGIELGAAPGAAEITPFTLAGMTPPTTEPALRRELDRATRTSGNFVRAINMARLLLALDADGNSTNGLDVSGRENALATATLNFEQPVYAFATQLDRLAPNLTRNIPAWWPVVHLYRAVNVSVAVHAPVRIETTNDQLFPIGGFSTDVITKNYGASGLLERMDTFFDGDLDHTYQFTYDPFGRYLTAGDLWGRFFGPLDDLATLAAYTYDMRGNSIRTVEDADDGADGSVNSRAVYERVFDAYGRQQTAAQNVDTDFNGGTDTRRSYSYVYDVRGNQVSALELDDYDADGIIDTRVLTTRAFDGSDRVVSASYEQDLGGDGTIDVRETVVVTWTDGGRSVRQTASWDQNGDGTPENLTVSTWNYDGAGKLLAWSSAEDLDADGSIDNTSSATIYYDRDGRVLTETQAYGYAGGGVSEYTSSWSYEYDALGNPVSFVQEGDFDGNRVVDTRTQQTWNYGSGGELLETSYHFDSGADGVFEFSSASMNTNTLIDAGVALLAQQYFTNTGGYADAP